MIIDGKHDAVKCQQWIQCLGCNLVQGTGLVLAVQSLRYWRSVELSSGAEEPSIPHTSWPNLVSSMFLSMVGSLQTQ